MYMEMSQGNSLYSYPKKTKMSFFQKQRKEDKTGPVWGLVPVGGGGYKESV
jgi:hypothetical protein